MIPHWDNIFTFCFSQQLPCLCLGSLKGFLWADKAPFKGPWLASCVASWATEKPGYSQVCRTRPRGPRTLSRTSDAKLNCAFCWKRTFLHRSLIVKSQQSRIELVTRPDHPFMADRRTIEVVSSTQASSDPGQGGPKKSTEDAPKYTFDFDTNSQKKDDDFLPVDPTGNSFR